MNINIKVKDLEKIVQELLADNVDYVELVIFDEEKSGGDIIPAALHFHAYDGVGGIVDYDGFDILDVDPFYKQND